MRLKFNKCLDYITGTVKDKNIYHEFVAIFYLESYYLLIEVDGKIKEIRCSKYQYNQAQIDQPIKMCKIFKLVDNIFKEVDLKIANVKKIPVSL